MSSSSLASRGWALLVGVGFVLIPWLGFSADDPRKPQDPPKRAKAKGKVLDKTAFKADNAGRAEARAILNDLRELADAVLGEGESRNEGATRANSTESLLSRLGRPQRNVTSPTLTADEIDRMVEKVLASEKVAPAKPIGDEGFARRLYLDVTGKPPTSEQVVAFAKDKDGKKRARLIDRLLASDEYAQNWARYWRDVIAYHATAENPRLANFPKFEEWMTDQLKQNRPWDEVVRDILTATGDNSENGAAAMIAAHSTNQRFQPVEMAGEVSRVFMGVQIACAQCHDHPTDPWKREQFHQFAAFFAGTQSRRAGMPPNISRMITDQRGAPRYQMPDLKEPQKQIPVQPKFFLATSESEVPRGLDSEQLRLVAASYVTGQDNPWFAKAFVNRVWYALMGEAFYNPIDDMGPERQAFAPEILDALASQWALGGYDIRWLFRTLLNTRTYQRQTRSTQSENGRTPFAANCPSRLRADQIFEALSQALETSFEGRAGRGERMPAAKSQAQGALAGGRRFDPRNLFNVLFGIDPSIPNDDVLGTIPQALFLMNAPQIARGIQASSRTSVLGRILNENPGDRAALDALYLQVLSRRPNDDEAKTCAEYLQRVGNRREAFEDILWALINSTEFVSRR